MNEDNELIIDDFYGELRQAMEQATQKDEEKDDGKL